MTSKFGYTVFTSDDDKYGRIWPSGRSKNIKNLVIVAEPREEGICTELLRHCWLLCGDRGALTLMQLKHMARWLRQLLAPSYTGCSAVHPVRAERPTVYLVVVYKYL